MFTRHFSVLAMSAYFSAMLASTISTSRTPTTITADIIPAATAALQAVIYSVSDELVKPVDAKNAVDAAKAATPTPTAKNSETKPGSKDAKAEKTPPAPPITKEAIVKLLVRTQNGKEANLEADVSRTLQLTAKDKDSQGKVATKQISAKSNESPNDRIFFGFVVDSGDLFIAAEKNDTTSKMIVYRFSDDGNLIVASIASNDVVSEYKGEEAQKGFATLAARWNKLSEKLPAPTKETVIASNDKGAAKDPAQKN